MTKVLTANCIHCGKEIFSLYKKQLTYNIAAHELSCPRREIDLKDDSKKKDVKND